MGDQAAELNELKAKLQALEDEFNQLKNENDRLQDELTEKTALATVTNTYSYTLYTFLLLSIAYYLCVEYYKYTYI